MKRAEPARVQFAAAAGRPVFSVYKVELGNVETLTSKHEAALAVELQRRLGKGSSCQMSWTEVGGRKARRVQATGGRQGQPWGLTAAWHLRGGQAWVFEALYPLDGRQAAEAALDALCRSVVWLRPERG